MRSVDNSQRRELKNSILTSMDGNADWWRRVLLGTIAAVVCAALVGGVYFWYVLASLTGSSNDNVSTVAPAAPVPSSTSTLQASQQALQKGTQSSASTTASPAVLQASQAALEKAVQSNKASSSGSASSDSSAAQQTQLEASQQALEKAVQQSKGQ